MTFVEKLVLKAIKVVINKAREEDKLNQVIKDINAEQGTVGMKYLIENEVCTPAEIATALLS